jgi:flagellar basal-body rod modification protein FlgD
MNITAAQAAAAVASQTTSNSQSASSASSVDPLANENTFLKLLVAQVQNQDPLQPTDSIQFVTQLAQFSSLEQLVSINQGIKTLDQTPPASSTPASSNS